MNTVRPMPRKRVFQVPERHPVIEFLFPAHANRHGISAGLLAPLALLVVFAPFAIYHGSKNLERLKESPWEGCRNRSILAVLFGWIAIVAAVVAVVVFFWKIIFSVVLILVVLVIVL